jgi:large subunit ribosomal protein L10
MAKTRDQKSEALQKLTSGFQNAKSVAFADYRGLTVPQVDELRGKMREANVEYVVAKKTLINRAAKEAGIELDAKQYEGMIGLAFGIEDEVAPAKVLGDMSKTTSVQILGGIFEGEVVGQDKMVSLSKLPGKLELLGTVVGTIYAPVSSFVRVLDAIRKAHESSSAEATEDKPAEAAPAEEAAAPESSEAPAEEPAQESESPAEAVPEPAAEAPAEASEQEPEKSDS